MLIYDKPLLNAQPPLNGNSAAVIKKIKEYANVTGEHLTSLVSLL